MSDNGVWSLMTHDILALRAEVVGLCMFLNCTLYPFHNLLNKSKMKTRRSSHRPPLKNKCHLKHWPLVTNYYHPQVVMLRTPELVGLAHQFCASYVSVCSRFRENNQILIISMKHALCIIHINDYYSNDLVLNDSNFILFRCDFIYNLLYDILSAELIFQFWVTSQ